MFLFMVSSLNVKAELTLGAAVNTGGELSTLLLQRRHIRKIKHRSFWTLVLRKQQQPWFTPRADNTCSGNKSSWLHLLPPSEANHQQTTLDVAERKQTAQWFVGMQHGCSCWWFWQHGHPSSQRKLPNLFASVTKQLSKGNHSVLTDLH